MADELPVRAGWAVWSKAAGSRQDYSVVACSSGPFSRADFAAIVTRFAAGTPDTTTSGPGALPWVTVSWVGVDTTLHLGIAVTDHTGQVDGVGRPITRTSYFCVPYTELAENAVSYTALYHAVAQIAREARYPADSGTVWLAVQRLTREQPVEAVRNIGRQAVCAAAALLLGGPVSVVQAEGSSLEERLEFIDTVASLLPYGFRARFSAATWSDSGTRHRIRLAFATRPRADATVVTWRRPVEVPVGGDAGAYFRKLQQLLGDGAPAVKVFPVPAVISYLARDTEPQRFEEPRAALASLHLLDLPFRVLRDIQDGSGADPAELRQVVRSGRLAELESEADVITLLGALADIGEAADWPDLRSWLDRLEDGRARWRMPIGFGRALLWTARPDAGAVREVLQYAAGLGGEDAALAELIRLPREGTADYQAGVLAAAGLLADAVLAADPDPRAYPLTWELLAGSPAEACEYLAALARTGRGAGTFLYWLTPPGPPPPVIGLFGVALGAETVPQRGDITHADVMELAVSGADCVLALLRAAAYAGQLERVLPGYTRWLASRGELDPAERRYWGEHLKVLDSPTPRLQAWLDTALLTVGAMPSDLPPAWSPAAESYATDVAGIWAGLSADCTLFSGERCARVLASFLGDQRWAADRQQAFAVTELAGRLREYDSRNMLVSAVAAALAATADAKQWDFARDWLAWVRDNDPGAVREGLLESLGSAAPGADPAQLAGLCLRACREGIEPDAAFRQLAKSGAVVTAEQAARLLTALQQEFAAGGVGHETAITWQLRAAAMLARGEFGWNVAYELRELMSSAARREIWDRLELLVVFAEGERERHYEWTDAERDDLTEMSAAIDSLLKKSRKFPALWRRNPLAAGEPGEAAEEAGQDGQPDGNQPDA